MEEHSPYKTMLPNEGKVSNSLCKIRAKETKWKKKKEQFNRTYRITKDNIKKVKIVSKSQPLGKWTSRSYPPFHSINLIFLLLQLLLQQSANVPNPNSPASKHSFPMPKVWQLTLNRAPPQSISDFASRAQNCWAVLRLETLVQLLNP